MLNRLIASLLPYLPRKFVWIFSRSYIAGETITDAKHVSLGLNNHGLKVTLDILGEFITSLDEAEANKHEYLNLIDDTQRSGLNCNYSLKPTSFGLLIDKETCYKHIREIVAKAASYESFCRIDMEDSPCTDLEIGLYRRLHAEYPANVGLVIQAYLKRSFNDLSELIKLNSKDTPVNFRLCKGIYVEHSSIAYKKYDEINSHYLEDLELLLSNGIYVGIATHDKNLIDGACRLIEKYKVPSNKYEFQMLYGVTPSLRNSIAAAGNVMRVYVPYGEKWFGYSTRRLKENPRMTSHIIKALFVRG
jgi:proline dehydrogenase